MVVPDPECLIGWLGRALTNVICTSCTACPPSLAKQAHNTHNGTNYVPYRQHR